MQKYYLTNAIPYVNASPHIGHALEFIQSDTLARYQKLLGKEVYFACGSDENALKNAQVALAESVPVQELVDKYALAFSEMAEALDVRFDIFQKTSDQAKHYLASQKLWLLCEEQGDIYKKSYQGLYCVGCEEFKSPEDLNSQSECPEHPGKKLEEVEEENYFFRLSKYAAKLISLIESDEYKITPHFRKNEILAFIKSGLKDFSISRSNARAKDWGIPVPNDPTQKIYVWFDALNVYQSAIGFGWDEKMYQKWWPADLHVIGKGIIRFHAVYWPAILLSAGLKLPRGLFVHEYFTVNGQKMSKTLGNVINPLDLVKVYGADAVRYYCLAKFAPFSDGDFSEEKLKEVYNSDLANGLGNLVSRVAKLAEKNNVRLQEESESAFFPEVSQALTDFKFNLALEYLWREISSLDQKLSITKPWTLTPKEANPIIGQVIKQINRIAYNLRPFLPNTAKIIEEQFKGPDIKSQTALFPRLP